MRVDSGVRPRQMLLAMAAAVLAAVVVISAVGRVAGFSDVRDTLRNANARWLVLCACGQVLVFVGYAGVFRRAIAVGGTATLPVNASIRLALASFAATQLFAFGGVGGLAVVYWAFRRVGRDRDEAAVLLIGLNTAVYLVFGVIGWTAAGLALLAAEAPLAMTVPWVLGFPLVLLAGRWFTAASRVDRWTAPGTTGFRRALATGVAAAAWTRGRLGDDDGRALFGWAAICSASALRCGRSAPTPAWSPSSPPTPPATSSSPCRSR
jgi:uncharacterized membrane protein YbhN (UPF0104 family)